MAATGRRSRAGSLRPVFVWVLAILVVPMVILFGFGFLNDIRSPWRFVAAPAYAVGAFVAPVIFIRRRVLDGVPRRNAIAGGLAIAANVLIADLFLFLGAGEGAYGAAQVVIVAGAAIAVALRWKSSVPPPPLRPDFVPPRSDL